MKLTLCDDASSCLSYKTLDECISDFCVCEYCTYIVNNTEKGLCLTYNNIYCTAVFNGKISNNREKCIVYRRNTALIIFIPFSLLIIMVILFSICFYYYYKPQEKLNNK